MTQKELIRDLSTRTGFTLTEAAAFIDIFKDCIVDGLIKDGVVRVTGIGSFKTHLRKAHTGYDVNKCEYTQKPDKIMVRCEINSRFNEFVTEKCKQKKEENSDEELC